MAKRKKWKILRNILILLLVVCVGITIRWYYVCHNGEYSTLWVHYIDVGQGDCTLIVCGEDTLLIDGGDNSQGTRIQAYLMKLGIKELDYVIATHPDADHIGGLDVILYKYDCDTIIMNDEKKDTKSYEELMDTIEIKNYEVTLPEAGERYELGEAYFYIVAPVENDYGDSNNYSVGIRLVHGNNSFLFLGDAEKEAEEDILEDGMDVESTVYKVSHHGSSSSTTEAFLSEIRPDYAVISCGQDNAYGHPHDEIIELLEKYDIKIYRTDVSGTVIAESDGRKIRWTTER